MVSVVFVPKAEVANPDNERTEKIATVLSIGEKKSYPKSLLLQRS